MIDGHVGRHLRNSSKGGRYEDLQTVASAVALPALAAYSTTGPAQVATLVELSTEELGTDIT